MDEREHVAIARRLIDAIGRGDVAAVDALYADDMTGWRNVDGRELSKRQMLKVVRFLASDVKDLRYDDVRIQPTATGYVQQHVLRATAPDGSRVEVPACLVVTVGDRAIRRIDEYMDSAALAPLLG